MTRRLAAIMFTDLVGFTRLGHRDEPAALRLRREHQALLRPIFARYGGREVKTMGDGFLVEFGSAVEAVQCGVEVQRAVAERNAPMNPEDRIQLRIGLHVGDVVEDEGDIVGDAVNVASRIEPIADPGGVCLSASVYDQVRNKLPVRFERIGLRRLKNVEEAVEIYRVAREAAAGPSGPPESVPTVTSHPRIAILPFRNISPDPGDSYFAEGLTEELIATVSRLGELRPIARTSVMRFKDSATGVSEAARELRVGALLEGSVRREGDHLRVTAQLIDATTEEPMWTMTFDRQLVNVFAIQEELARRIAESLHVRMLGDTRHTLGRVPTRSMEAYDLYLQGRQRFFEVTSEGFAASIALFERAITLDPAFALAHCGLAESQALQGNRGFVPLGPALERAEVSARKALALDPELGEAHAALAPILFNRYDWSGALRELDRAILLEPNNAQGHFWRAVTTGSTGHPEEGLGNALRAVELDPLNPRRRVILAQQYYWLRRYEEALSVLGSPIMKDAAGTGALALQAYALFMSGRAEEAVNLLSSEAAAPLAEPLQQRIDRAAITARAGNPAGARAILAQLLDPPAGEVVPPGGVAWVYAALGDFDRAAEWYVRARSVGDIVGVPDLIVDPFLDPLRASPKSTEILQLFHFPAA